MYLLLDCGQNIEVRNRRKYIQPLQWKMYFYVQNIFIFFCEPIDCLLNVYADYPIECVFDRIINQLSGALQRIVCTPSTQYTISWCCMHLNVLTTRMANMTGREVQVVLGILYALCTSDLICPALCVLMRRRYEPSNQPRVLSAVTVVNAVRQTVWISVHSHLHNIDTVCPCVDQQTSSPASFVSAFCVFAQQHNYVCHRRVLFSAALSCTHFPAGWLGVRAGGSRRRGNSECRDLHNRVYVHGAEDNYARHVASLPLSLSNFISVCTIGRRRIRNEDMRLWR